MKNALILAVSTVVAVSVSGQPNRASNGKQIPAGQHQPSVIDPNGVNEQCCCCADQSKTNSNPPKWYAPIKRPEWWLVIIGAATGGIVGWQSAETRGAARAGRDAARAALQQIQLMKEKERARIRITILRPNTINIGLQPGNEIRMSVENIGSTLAQNITAQASPSVEVDGFETLDEMAIDPQELGIPSIMRPEDPAVETWVWFFIPEQWSEQIGILNPKIRIMINGMIRYDDIFGDGHITPFKYLLTHPRTLKWIGYEVAETHPFSQWHQDGDEENRAT